MNWKALVGWVAVFLTIPLESQAGLLYGMRGAELYSIDRVTASATLVGSYATTAYPTSIAFDPVTGILYGMRGAELYSIDKATASATLVGSYATTAYPTSIAFDYSVTPVPEPETYAMMLAGLGLLSLTARRQKQKLNA